MMKKILPFFLISSFCCAPAMAQDHAGKDCVISVKAVPWATVNIDGVRAGTTPIKKTVSCDEHDVELTLPSKNISVNKTVTFNKGKSESITYDFTTESWKGAKAADKKAAPAAAVKEQDVRAIKDKLNKKSEKSDASSEKGDCSLAIKAKPWAIVTIDGKRIGNTPQKKNDLSCDAHVIELRQPARNATVVEYISLKRTSYAVASYNFEKEEWEIDKDAVASEDEAAAAEAKKLTSKDEIDKAEPKTRKDNKVVRKGRTKDTNTDLPF